MPRRFLFGPVTSEFAGENLQRFRESGDCLAFNDDGSAGLPVGPGDSWESVLAKLPDGWRPEFVALWLPYTTIPACLWSSPVPLVGLATDWNLLWHHYRRWLRRCDLAFSDDAGAADREEAANQKNHRAGKAVVAVARHGCPLSSLGCGHFEKSCVPASPFCHSVVP
jgi:hypothetical protein